jgi:hypothetical protein
MKTDIFAGNERGESGESTRGVSDLIRPAGSGSELDGYRRPISFVDAHPAPEVQVSSTQWQPKQRLRPKKQSRVVV